MEDDAANRESLGFLVVLAAAAADILLARCTQ